MILCSFLLPHFEEVHLSDGVPVTYSARRAPICSSPKSVRLPCLGCPPGGQLFSSHLLTRRSAGNDRI